MSNTEQKVEVSKEDIDWIKNQLLEQSTTLLRINQTLVGDREYGLTGIVETVKEHQKYIDKEKDMKAKFVGAVGVVGVAWTLLLKFWDNVF